MDTKADSKQIVDHIEKLQRDQDDSDNEDDAYDPDWARRQVDTTSEMFNKPVSLTMGPLRLGCRS
jgi:hypothetical protein